MIVEPGVAAAPPLPEDGGHAARAARPAAGDAAARCQRPGQSAHSAHSAQADHRGRNAWRRLLLLPLTLWLWVLLMVLGLMSLAGNLIALPLLLLLPRPPAQGPGITISPTVGNASDKPSDNPTGLSFGQRFGRAGIAYGYRTFWAMARASGLLRLDAGVLDVLRNEPRLIIVANHPSMLDAVMLAARLPRSICIMKASLLRNVFLGAGARLAGYISNGSAMGMLRQAVTDLRQGGQLLLFPEGTRTTRWPLDPFQASAPLIAKLAQAPIQAVFIDTDSPYLGKGWPLWRLPPLPIVFRVRLGRRFEPPANANALRDELEAYYRADLHRADLHHADTPAER